MKLNYFYGSIAIVPKDGYTENLEFNATEQTNKLEFRYPYGQISPEQAEAISQFVNTVTKAYNKLSSQIDIVNRELQLEQYAPIAKSEEISSNVFTESLPSQPLRGGSDPTDLVEHSQQEQERLDMEELGTEESEEDTGL